MGSTFGQPLRPAATNGGKKVSYRKVVNEFMSHLDKDVHSRGDAIYTHQDFQESFNRARLQCSEPTFSAFVERLNHDGYITKKPGGRWKVEGTSTSMHGSQRQ